MWLTHYQMPTPAVIVRSVQGQQNKPEGLGWTNLIFHAIISDLHQQLVTVNVITIYYGTKLIIHATIITCIRMY